MSKLTLEQLNESYERLDKICMLKVDLVEFHGKKQW